MSHVTRMIRPRSVVGDGQGLVSRGGLAWLGETMDLSGLTAGLSDAMSGLGWRRHNPGRTLG